MKAAGKRRLKRKRRKFLAKMGGAMAVVSSVVTGKRAEPIQTWRPLN